jgi:hypothetical protein
MLAEEAQDRLAESEVICGKEKRRKRNKLIVAEAARLLREEGTGETPQAKAEEAPGPPVESEPLQRKSTTKLTRNPQKQTVKNRRSVHGH